MNDWMSSAACKSLTDLFYDVDGESPSAKREREIQAKSICHRCRVRKECLDYSITNGIRTGIWGGISEAGRRSLIRQNLKVST